MKITNFPPDFYTHPQETWSAEHCAKLAKAKYRDTTLRGCVSPSGVSHCRLGESMRFNGGCERDGNWYPGEAIPLPSIPDSYEFYDVPSWGRFIRKRA